MLDQMEKSTEHAVALIDKLLTLARRGNYQGKPLSLASCVDEFIHSAALRKMQDEHPAITLQLELNDTLPMILGSQTHIHQVLLNLIKNAFEAIDGSGSVRISSSRETFDRVLDGFEEVAAGEFCVIRVTDDGCGIHKKELERIFEPFYSSKFEGGRGTGLGLAMVYGVVKDMSASIEVHSELGTGTEFIVRFPVTQKTAHADTNIATDLRGHAHVLIIDDLDIQRQLGSKMLEALGYSVDVAENSSSALALLTNRDGATDVIVSDMQLDTEDGLDVYHKIHPLYPDVPFVLVSGYGESERISQALAEGVCAFVRKPYTQAGFAQAIKSALSS